MLKQIIRLAILVGVVVVVVRLVRTRLVPAPQPPAAEPPRFRVAPQPPAAPAPAGDAADDLTAIHGIGPVYAMRLRDHGIATFAALAAADAAALAEQVGARPDQTESWISEAAGRA